MVSKKKEEREMCVSDGSRTRKGQTAVVNQPCHCHDTTESAD